MLGRLRLTIPQAIANFSQIAAEVFPVGRNPWYAKTFKLGVGDVLYDGEVLERAVQSLLLRNGGDVDMPLKETENPKCRV